MKEKKLHNFLENLRYWRDKTIKKRYKAKGHEHINTPLNELEYQSLMNDIYGNQYLDAKYADYLNQLPVKRWLVDLVSKYLKDIHMVLDAGANRGYLMEAFRSQGYDAYGFDILEDTSLVLENSRANYKLGSILDIPEFDVKFDLVTCIDVFEHIPINFIDKMAEELLKLNPQYFVFQISNDVISDGHITIQSTKFWVNKFIKTGKYRLMSELTSSLKETVIQDGSDLYINTGLPRNGFNQVPGILFFERKE